MSDLNLKFIAKFVDQLTGPSRRAIGHFYGDVGKSRKKFDRSMQTAGNLSLVGAESMRMGKAIGRSLLEPISVAADFEEAMDTVKAITGANTNEFENLTSTARMLGETTSFSASEAAEGMKYLGMAGFETNQVIDSMPGVLNLAKSGAVELGRAADISSDILSGFGLEAADMGRVGDVLTKTFTSSNTTLDMLGETMKYIGPLAKTAGIDIETMAAMTGLLGNAGIKGSQAGTTLRAMLSRLTAPSKEAANTLAMLGVEIENSEGNMRPLLDIIGDLESGMNGMGNVEQLATLKEIFGEEPASGIAELMSQGKDGITEYEKELRNAGGTSNRIAKEMGDNAKGGVKEWRSAIESLSITIGNELLPQITPLIKDVTAMTRRMTTWAAANPETIKTILMLTAGLAGLLMIVGPIASVLSGLVSTLALVKFALSFVTLAVKLLGKAFLMNPIGLAVAAIGAAAYLIITDWEGVKQFFSDLWDGTKQIFSSVSEWMVMLINDPIGTLKDSWNSIGDFFTDLWAGIKITFNESLKWIQDTILNPIQTIKDTLGSAWDAIVGDSDISATVKSAKEISTSAEIANVQPTTQTYSQPQPTLVSGNGDISISIPISVKASANMNEDKLASVIAERVRIEVTNLLSRAES